MVGWWIVIGKKKPEEWDLLSKEERIAETLASWETSPSGIEWLEKLTKEGKAAQLYKGGYPSRFTTPALHILPLISSGPPPHDGETILGDDYVMPGNWDGNMTTYPDKIAGCPPDQILTIDVWDLS